MDLAPTGKLRAAINFGNPVLAQKGPNGEPLTGRERLIVIHGNRFVLFRVFSQIDLNELNDVLVYLETIKAQSEKLANECLNSIIPQINSLYPDSYPGNIFKNQDRQTQLLKSL